MADRESSSPAPKTPAAANSAGGVPPIVVQVDPQTGRARRWMMRLLALALVVSLIFNLVLYASYEAYFSGSQGPREVFHSGQATAGDKIALIEARGTISPPFTGQIRRAIAQAEKDDDVKGVLLVIDSPGGLVADSHQIYHDLVKLREKKPIYVAMQRIAASGGYYIAMGAGPEGKIYAEPTTWTGSIGVIIPRFDLSQLADKVGVQSDSLKTGPLKDALNPLRELTADERQVWETIMDDSFQRFLHVIADNRPALGYDKVKALATGQVYTADQAKQNGLIDVIGYQDEAVEALQKQLGLKNVRVVKYEFPFALLDLVLGLSEARQERAPWEMLLEAGVPRAWYHLSWAPLGHHDL